MHVKLWMRAMVKVGGEDGARITARVKLVKISPTNSTTHYPLPTTHYPLPTTHYLRGSSGYDSTCLMGCRPCVH